MSKLSLTSSRKLIKIIKKLGFSVIRQKGSHVRLTHPDGRKTSIPIHSGEKIGKGLLRKILRDVHLDVKEYNKLK